MKTTKTTSAFLAMAGASLMTLSACGDESSTSTDDAAPVSASDVAAQTSDAADTAKQFASSQMTEFKQTMRDQLDAMDETIDEFAAKVSEMSGTMKTQAEAALDDLREKRDAFAKQLDDAQADSAEAWQDVKSGLSDAWNDLKSAASSAADRFGDGADPTGASG